MLKCWIKIRVGVSVYGIACLVYFLGVGYEPLTVSYFGQRLVLFCSAKKGTKKGGKNPIAPLFFLAPALIGGDL